MVSAKDCHTMTSYYAKRFKEHYGRDANVNRYSARWGFEAVLMGMSTAKAQELVDYYFTTPGDRDHSLEWFFYNYDKLYDAMRAGKRDAEQTAKLESESKQRVAEWRASGKRGITSD